jgi:hypothetical protein
MAKPTKLDRLEEGIGRGQSLAEIKSVATSVGFWQERFAARPAAELLIEQGAPGADAMQKTLDTMPITGRDKKADLLRAACRSALERDGIPADVERTARRFYERGGGKPAARPAPVVTAEPSYSPIEPTGSPELLKLFTYGIRKLFGWR